MATFEARIEAVTGINLGGSTPFNTTELTSVLTEGAEDVIVKLTSVDPSKIELFTSTSADTDDSGVTCHMGRKGVTSVVREHDSTSILRPASEIPLTDRYEATDSDSLKFRSKYNPGWFFIDGAVKVVPAAASSTNSSFVTRVIFPTVSYNDVSIDNFNDQYEYLVVLYGCIKVLQSELNRSPDDLPEVFAGGNGVEVPLWSYSSKTLPEPPTSPGPPSFSTPSFTYDNAELGYVHLGSSLSSFTTSPPVFNAPGLGLPILSTLNSLTLPDTPSLPGLTLDYEIQEGATTTLFGSISVPTFNKPGLGIPADPGFADFSLTAISPGSPPVPSFTDPTALSIADLGLPAAPVFVKPTVPGTGNELQTITAGTTEVTDLNKLYDIITDYIITEEDTEISSALTGHVGTILNSYNAQMTTNMNEYNAASARYQQEVSAEMNRLQRVEQNQTSNRDFKFQRETQQYGQELAAWNARLQEYNQAVQNEVTEYTTDTNLKLQVWQASVANSFTLYNNDMQGSMNEYQKDLAIYQQKLQIATAESGNRNTEDSQKLALFSQDLGKYQADVAAQVQLFQQNEIHNKFTVWNQEFQNELAKYNALLASEQARFGSELNEYTQDIQREMTNLNNEQAALQSRMQQQTQLNTTNEQQEMQRQVAEFGQQTAIEQAEYSQELARYASETQRYTTELDKFSRQQTIDVQDFTTKLQEVNTIIASEGKAFTERQSVYNSDFQKQTVKMQHLISRLADMKAEYESFFGLESQALQRAEQQKQQLMQRSGLKGG